MNTVFLTIKWTVENLLSVVLVIAAAYLGFDYSTRVETMMYDKKIVDEFASSTYNRLTWTELHLATFRRGGDLDELTHRKKQYDDSYALFNERSTNLLRFIKTTGEGSRGILHDLANNAIWSGFKGLDWCLTKAYDLAVEDARVEKAAEKKAVLSLYSEVARRLVGGKDEAGTVGMVEGSGDPDVSVGLAKSDLQKKYRDYFKQYGGCMVLIEDDYKDAKKNTNDSENAIDTWGLLRKRIEELQDCSIAFYSDFENVFRLRGLSLSDLFMEFRGESIYRKRSAAFSFSKNTLDSCAVVKKWAPQDD